MLSLIEFIASPPEDSLVYANSYSLIWVTVSVLLAILSAYGALMAVARIQELQDTVTKVIWSVISSVTFGLGVWAMHFIGMLALSLPCVVNYDPVMTMISMIPGILAAGIALGVVWQWEGRLSLLYRSVLLGAGIGTMHYTGMIAMRLEGFVRYDPSLFVLSFFVAISLSYLALRLKEEVPKQQYLLVAIILGGAASGMHYTGMSAAYFLRGNVDLLPATVFTTNTLAITVALTTLFLVQGAMAFAAISRSYEVTRQLRDSEERWKFALEGAGDGVWDWNPITDEAVFSRRWKEMIGYAEDEFPNNGSAWVEHLHPEDKDRVLHTIQEYFAGHQPFYIVEFRMRNKDGCWKWILGRGKVISRDASGAPLRMIGTHTDITERKQAEEQLHIAATAFESQEGMVITDVNCEILRVNRAFTEITGYSAEEAVGQTTRMLKSGRHNAEFYREMWDSIQSTGGWQGEVWDRRKNGEEYPKWLTISAVKNNNGVVTHYIGTHFDITERKKAEEKIRKLAFFDQLTGLPNRTLLMDRLSQAMTISARNDRYGALLILDLDNFKMLNDTLGHDMGDQLLKQVAKRLIACVRDGDTVSRLGGDEFVVILLELAANRQEASAATDKIAEKILATLDQNYQFDDVEHHCTASIGVSLFKGHLAGIDELMKQSDVAMYKSKAAGRNVVQFFDATMN